MNVHSDVKIFVPETPSHWVGGDGPSKIYQSSSMTNLRKLAALWHIMVAYVGGFQKVWEQCSLAAWFETWLTSKKTTLPIMFYPVEFGRCRTDGMNQSLGGSLNKLYPQVPPFNVSRDHRQWHRSNGCPWLSVTSYRFQDNRRDCWKTLIYCYTMYLTRCYHRRLRSEFCNAIWARKKTKMIASYCIVKKKLMRRNTTIEQTYRQTGGSKTCSNIVCRRTDGKGLNWSEHRVVKLLTSSCSRPRPRL